MQTEINNSILLLRHVFSKEFNCKGKDSHIQWYFRKTIFKLWVETVGQYDWRAAIEWKQVPWVWVQTFKTKCRWRVLISDMCLWLCLRYEGRMLLDLCSELGYSHRVSFWQTIIWWPSFDQSCNGLLHFGTYNQLVFTALLSHVAAKLIMGPDILIQPAHLEIKYVKY